MSKKLIYVNLGRGMGKTSIALTEYHKFKQRGERVNILVYPDYLKSLRIIANKLNIPMFMGDIITGDDYRGRTIDRLIIDDAEQVLTCPSFHSINHSINNFLDTMFLLTDKILFTSSHITNFELKDYLYKRKNIEWTHYTEADLKGYKFGV
jgi:hypothetical protein